MLTRSLVLLATLSVLAVAAVLAPVAQAQRFAYSDDGFGSPPTGTVTYEVENTDGWDGVLTILSANQSTVETVLSNNGCTITSGTPPQIDCSAIEDFDVVTDYVVALAFEISTVETTGTTVRATFTDGAGAWSFMPSGSDTTAMEVMQESSDGCTWACTYGIGVYDDNDNSVFPYITCYTDPGSSCCELNCPPLPDPPGDGGSRLGGMISRLGGATF